MDRPPEYKMGRIHHYSICQDPTQSGQQGIGGFKENSFEKTLYLVLAFSSEFSLHNISTYDDITSNNIQSINVFKVMY